ncbi:hypothetical protein BJ875DRAFT_441551 [Amylocarpus encephaloides]|uniref:Hydantoinase/oxoprolinase n=1 Tax=Amylocarpus encephaloides TaxID=45428 RepID=A0A9P7YHX2_9HELO|nr:hypothetical protein BJ875DRAFT_441551 [Amylocarpus encephaloides]
MPSKVSPYVIGVDVGGTNTDAVILQDETVLAWHKTSTTIDIQQGVECAIKEVVKKAGLPLGGRVSAVKIGTTQFLNAVLEQDSSKLDKVAVIRLCGSYSRCTPPFLDFPPSLRSLVEGNYGYVDGGYQVDATPIATLNGDQLRAQAEIIKAKSIKSIVVIGVYSPSNPTQEEEARSILASLLGDDYDISCSHEIGRLGFLERENASILNASLRRFAQHVIAGFYEAVESLDGCGLYITLNDGTMSKASAAAEYPIRCFASGPTNSARGAALLARSFVNDVNDNREVLIIDVGGTTTDICALLKTGYPRQSAAFVKIAGVRTNFSIPDVHSIALGGGSLVRAKKFRTSIGPDSLGAMLDKGGIAFGGTVLTATDLVLSNNYTDATITPDMKCSGLSEITRVLEEAIDKVKTRQGDARIILVGGGSIIVRDRIAGVGEIVRPEYCEVANAVGAAVCTPESRPRDSADTIKMGKISGSIDRTVVPQAGHVNDEISKSTSMAIEKCVAAGGDKNTIEIVEVDVVPVSYVKNGAARILVRVVADLTDHKEEQGASSAAFNQQILRKRSFTKSSLLDGFREISKGSSYAPTRRANIQTYRPRIEGDLWYLSELDLQFLQDGAGVLSVGSCGEPYSAYLTCLMALRNGEDITIRRQSTLSDDAVILVAGMMGSPSVYLERIPGRNEVTDAMKGILEATGLDTFDAVIPNEIGGLNAFEAILAARHFSKSTLDTDLVARAYPMVWQTVRCLKDVPIAPACVANGAGKLELFKKVKDNLEAEDLMREACTNQGSLSGMCINPLRGLEAKTLPRNSFSHAWTIGRTIALARFLKQDPITNLLASENGVLLFTGKIISVTRNVAEGFTRGTVLLESHSEINQAVASSGTNESLVIDFENENLCAVLKKDEQPDQVLAVCPDLITVLDQANGAPLGISDYKYGLRVSVIALRAPPVWTTEKGLAVGGPKAFGLDFDYQAVHSTSHVAYEDPKSVWDIFSKGF